MNHLLRILRLVVGFLCFYLAIVLLAVCALSAIWMVVILCDGDLFHAVIFGAVSAAAAGMSPALFRLAQAIPGQRASAKPANSLLKSESRT